MKKKNAVISATVFIVMVVILSILAFLLSEKTAYFWTGFIFTLLAAALILGVILNLRGGRVKELPYASLAIQYAVIEVVLTAIFCTMGWAIPGLSTIYFVVAQFLLLIIYVILIAVAFNADKKAAGLQQEAPRPKDWNSIAEDIEGVVDRIGDLPQGISSGTMQRLFRLNETAHNSKAVSAENLRELEDGIRSAVSELSSQMDAMIANNKEDSGDFEAAMGRVEKLVEERNQKLKEV